ncbi:MAG TPA: PEGA domain-containing protein, partial [Methanoregula sp.]|nr:PEGA domain-containing protein [Methanoregula sp.]
MFQNFMNTRSWFLIAIFVIGIAAFIPPGAAADNVSYIQVSSNPSGAVACFDHWNCLNTPITFATDPNSYHSISVYKDGYQISTQTVYANNTGVTISVMVNLIANPPQTGSLNLDSSPSGADIWLDQRYYGTTPQIIGGLSEGSHSLTLRNAGYYDSTTQLTITAGKTTTLSLGMSPYTPSSGFGDLRIQSNPVGAAVYVNNNYTGTTISSTPLYVTQLKPGSYAVRVTLAGYQIYSQTAAITAGKVSTVQANLVAVSPGPTPYTNGQVIVRSSPSGANIYLDNAYRGLTPLTLVDIPQGSHAIILKLNGYQDWQSSVNVVAGSSTDVSGTLASSPQPTPTT